MEGSLSQLGQEGQVVHSVRELAVVAQLASGFVTGSVANFE